ncbi:hypothetical protein GGF31_001210 [Allomyces arbusculus]|nr:hypothetical protein GGF31_001210 [Allomyces arbusculus]
MEVAASSLAHPASPHSWSSLTSSQLIGNLPLWNDVVAQLASDDEVRPDDDDGVEYGPNTLPAGPAIPPRVFIPLSSGTDASRDDDSVLDPLASRPSPSDRSPELMWGQRYGRAACLEPPPTIGMTPTLGATPIPSSEPVPSLSRSAVTPASSSPSPLLQRSFLDAVSSPRSDPAADLPAKVPAADTAHATAPVLHRHNDESLDLASSLLANHVTPTTVVPATTPSRAAHARFLNQHATPDATVTALGEDSPSLLLDSTRTERHFLAPTMPARPPEPAAGFSGLASTPRPSPPTDKHVEKSPCPPARPAKRFRGRDSGSLFLTQLAKRARASPAPALAPASVQTESRSDLATPTSMAPATTSSTPRRRSRSPPPATPPPLDGVGGNSLPLDVIHALPEGDDGGTAGNTGVPADAAAVVTLAAIEDDAAVAVPVLEQPVPACPAPFSPSRLAPPARLRPAPPKSPTPRATRSSRLRNPPPPPAPPVAPTAAHRPPTSDTPVAAGPGRSLRSTRARRAAASPAPNAEQPAPGALKRALASHPPAIPATYAIDQLIWAKWPKSNYFHAAKVRQLVSRTNTFKVRLVDGGTAVFLPASDLRPYHAPAHGDHACARESAAISRALAVTVVESADDTDDEYHVEFHRSRKRVRKYVPFEAVLVSEEQMRQVDERRPAPDVDAVSVDEKRVPVDEEREEVEGSRKNEEMEDQPAPPSPPRPATTPTVKKHDGAMIAPMSTPIRSNVRHKKLAGLGPCRPGPISNRIPVVEVTIPALPGRSPVLGSISKKSNAFAAKCRAVNFASELAKPPPCRDVPILTGLVFVITMSGADDGWAMVGLPERFEPAPAKFGRDRVIELVEKHGGRVVDDLDDAEVVRAPFICLATVPKRTPKYLFALARGMPCVSCQWIMVCDALKKRVDMDLYRLPNGYSIDLQAPLSAVTRAVCMQGVTVAIADGFEYLDEWTRILRAAGAMLVDSAAAATYWLVSNNFDPDAATSGTDPVTEARRRGRRGSRRKVEHGPAAAASSPARRGAICVTVEWAIQCLINQRIVNPRDHVAVYQPQIVGRGRERVGLRT